MNGKKIPESVFDHIFYHIVPAIFRQEHCKPGNITIGQWFFIHRVEDVCASFQEAVVDVLVGKTLRAAVERGVKTVSASGGVSVNRRFREVLTAGCADHGLQLLLAPAKLCTDNAAMIAALAYYKLQSRKPSDFSLEVAPSMGLGAGGRG